MSDLPKIPTVIHRKFLPFTREQLLPHFNDEKHLDYFAASAIRYAEFVDRFGANFAGMPITKEVRLKRQIERDERFWTACTLKTAFDNEVMAGILRAAFGNRPPLQAFPTWETCIGDRSEQTLRFEVAVSSPRLYREHLRSHFQRKGRAAHLVPYIRDAAQGRTDFEGPTKVDAVFANTKNDFCVLFEAKLLSDISCDVTFDPLRNQLARNVDVMIDNAEDNVLSPDPSKRLLCLLTPKLFKERPSTRFYGVLYEKYKLEPKVLQDHLAHRRPTELEGVPPRLGWLAFEECEEAYPNCCPWVAEARAGVIG
jgi:hypothetical protein